MIELIRHREFGIEHTPPAAASPVGSTGRERHHFRQPVVGLWTQYNVYKGRTPKDFFAFGLRNTAGNRDHHRVGRRRPGFLQVAQSAEL